jgi:hypothetical protein
LPTKREMSSMHVRYTWSRNDACMQYGRTGTMTFS